MVIVKERKKIVDVIDSFERIEYHVKKFYPEIKNISRLLKYNVKDEQLLIEILSPNKKIEIKYRLVGKLLLQIFKGLKQLVGNEKFKSESMFYFYCGYNFRECQKLSKHKKTPIFPEYWLMRGYKPLRANINALKCFKDLNNKNKLISGTETSWNRGFWLKRGYSLNESIFKISKTQSRNVNKWVEKKKEDPSKYAYTYSTKIEHYLSKGLNEQEAKKALKERQSTFSLEKCIKKYGEEGLNKWQERQDKWQKTLNNKPQEEIDEINKSKAMTLEKCIKKYGDEEGKKKFTEINKSKAMTLEKCIKKYGDEEGKRKYFKWLDRERSSNSFSKESIIFFKKLLSVLDLKTTEVIFATNNKREFNIKHSNGYFYYDFVIPNRKIIIEYHGNAFHPKKDMSEEYYDSWKSAFGASGREIRNRDILKKRTAEKEGFLFLEIWSDEVNNIDIVENIITTIKNKKDGEHEEVNSFENYF